MTPLGVHAAVLRRSARYLSPGHLRRAVERLVPARSDTGSGTSVVGGLGFPKDGGQNYRAELVPGGGITRSPHLKVPIRIILKAA